MELEHSGHLGSHPARILRHVGPSVPERGLPAADAQLNISEPDAHPSTGRLPAGYYAVLEVEQVLAGAGEVEGHT